jgi:16S rRNA (guanine966-N2)-methyltransferase
VRRPTSERVKEAIFAVLGDRIHGAELIDLCCGAGGLGIEGLSRGAALVHFVDLDRAALHLVQANLAQCGAEAESFALHRADARRWLRPDRLHGVGPLLVVADPPYGGPLSEQLLEQWLHDDRQVEPRMAILEHASTQVLEAPVDAAFRVRRKEYGATALTILEARS